MNFRHAELMSRLLNVPLLAHPGKAAVIYNVLAGRFGTQPIELPEMEASLRERVGAPQASRFEGDNVPTADQRGIEPYKLSGNTGIVSITGSLVDRGAWVGANSGVTSYEGIKHQIARAARDTRVENILLDISSPGGEALGAYEAAGAVRAAAKRKNVVAVANSMAASAAYNIASGARRIVVSPSSWTGSVGVVMLHLDQSEALAQAGIKPTLIFAGDHKVDGNPLEPLPPSVKAEWTAEVFRHYELFLQSIEAGRGKIAARRARESQGRTFMGAEAVANGLADEVGTFEDVIAELNRARPRGAAQRRSTMPNAERDDDLIPRAEADRMAQAAAASAAATARTEGEQAGRTAGRTEATARISAILASDKIKGHEAFALGLAVDAPDMSVEAIERAIGRIPAAAAPAVRPLAERAAGTGADQVTGGPTAAEAAQQTSGAVNPMIGAAADVKKRLDATARRPN